MKTLKTLTGIIALATTATLMLTACADQTELPLGNAALQDTSAKQTVDNSIQFAPYMGRTNTRAIVDQTYNGGTLYTSTLPTARFGVFGYNTGSADYAPNTFAANFMYNQQLKYDDGTSAAPTRASWVYSPVKYWPNTSDLANAFDDPSNTATPAGIQKLSFFAYSPYAKNILLTAKTDPDENTIDQAASAYPATPLYGALPKLADGTTDITPFKTANYATATTTGGVVGMTQWTELVDPWVNYVMKDGYDGTMTDPSKGIDLLWGLRGQYIYNEADGTDYTVPMLGNNYNVNLTKQGVDEKVRFMFKHALAKIGGSTKDESYSAEYPSQTGFKVVVDIDGNSTEPGQGTDQQESFFPMPFNNLKTLVTVQSVKVRDPWTYAQEPGTTLNKTTTKSNLNTFGWFNISDGTWLNAGHSADPAANGGAQGAKVQLLIDNTGNAGVAQLHPEIAEKGIGTTKVIDDDPAKPWQWKDVNPKGATTVAKPLYDNANADGIMLIPGSTPQTLYVTVDYFVRTADPQLAKGYSEVEQIITNKVELQSLEANKYYTIVIHLGLTSVKFEAIVADWAMNGGDSYDENGQTVEDPATPENKAVWLPSNVVNTTTINAFAGTTHKYVTVDAATLLYTVNMTGLTDGNTLTVTGTGNFNSATTTTTAISGGAATVNVGLLPNNTVTEPETVITITEKDGTSATVTTTVLHITQSAGDLLLTASIAEAAYNQAPYTITATYALGSAVDLGDATVTANAASGATTAVAGNVITVTPAVNNETANRDIVVTVTKGGLTKSLTISQAAGPLTVATVADAGTATWTTATATLTFTKEAIDVAPTYTVKKSDGAVTASPVTDFATSDSWLSVNATDGRLKASANTTGAPRTATVTVHYNDATGTFKVTQSN